MAAHIDIFGHNVLFLFVNLDQMTSSNLIGRQKERKQLTQFLKSKKSEFVAVYGRRRVGKTFLIKEFFSYKFDFYMSGLANADTSQQLFNFNAELSKQGNEYYPAQPENWLVAFQRLMHHIESIPHTQKKILFVDELPWFDTHGSDFMIALEHFWNTWATNRKDIVLIVCGSAASWMINELINHTGGLHNRVTQRMKIEPFSLKETEEMLLSKNCVFDKYQIIQLYMCIGGMPYYLDAIESGMSATQNIQELFFSRSATLKNEFFNLYRSLYKKHEVYEKIVETLAIKTNGMNRNELISKSGLKSGGTLTKVLNDLEESGFITSYISLDTKQKNTIYRLSDYYTAFYFNFIAQSKDRVNAEWIQMIDHPTYRAWQGFTFEQVCLDHVASIKKALGIHGIVSNQASWIGNNGIKSSQIDLLIDRRDHVVNICECKFSLDTFTINKSYADELRSKISIFKDVSQTKKAVHLAMVTTYGVSDNQYKDMLVQNEITMDDLFI